MTAHETRQAIAKLLNVEMGNLGPALIAGADLETRKAIQGLLGVAQDGAIGPKTRAAFNALAGTPDASPWSAVVADNAITEMAPLSPKAVALILEFEGMDQPARWPGAGSGITLGHGFDLGFATESQFREAWERYLSPAHVDALLIALGKTGEKARVLAPRFKGITLTKAEADEVFARCTVPRWVKLTGDAYPGAEMLPADAQGALVSLCFNRGTAMKGDKRSEMLKIRDRIAEYVSSTKTDSDLRNCLTRIAAHLRAMKRLWPIGTDVGAGLQRRREAEARLVESCITA